MRVCLPATEKIPTSSYFGISLPLSVILATPATKMWYYENFINIYMESQGNPCFVNFSFGMMARYTSVFEYTVSTEKDTENQSIIDRVKFELKENGNYAYLYVDEYYISCKEAYNQEHFHHQALIYGYDDEESCFFAIAFDKTGHFAKLKYPYTETERGYAAAFKCDNKSKNDMYGVIFFRVRKDFCHQIYFPNIILNLQEYVNGTIPHNLQHVQHNMPYGEFHQDSDAVFGINVLKETIDILENTDVENIDFPAFRRIHFMHEHAEMLLDRLRFYQQYLKLADSTYEKALVDFENIIEMYQHTRLLFLKLRVAQRFLKTNRASFLRTIKYIQSLYFKIYKYEKEVLFSVISCLSNSTGMILQREHALFYELTNQAKEITNLTNNEKVCIFSFEKAVPVNIVSFLALDKVCVYFDSIYYDCFIGNYIPETIEIPVNRWVREISFHYTLDSANKIRDLPVRIYGGNVFLEAEASASSSWTGDDGDVSNTIYSPSKALNSNMRWYWRASVQKNEYDGNDWYSLKLKYPNKINCILLSELSYSPRLKHYTIYYYDGEGNEKELLTHNTDVICKHLHRFSTVEITGLKIVFRECFGDTLNYFEPIISYVEGYCIDTFDKEYLC